MRRTISAACSPVSCALSLALYGRWEALCARAYEEDWRLWCRVLDAVMGEGHCRESWEWWRGTKSRAPSRNRPTVQTFLRLLAFVIPASCGKW